jgi:protein-S-isoprenylcysteine O-methyltransferase Ste14
LQAASQNVGPQIHTMPKLELKVPPLVLCAVFVAAIVALAHFVPAANIAFVGHQAIAIAALLFGIAVAIAGVVAFRTARTTVNPMAPGKANAVVVFGIYRWSRNPMYLGMAVALFGVACWRSTLPGYLLVPAFCAYMNKFQIKPEERALLARFGQEFSDYMNKVRRWL